MTVANIAAPPSIPDTWLVPINVLQPYNETKTLVVGFTGFLKSSTNTAVQTRLEGQTGGAS